MVDAFSSEYVTRARPNVAVAVVRAFVDPSLPRMRSRQCLRGPYAVDVQASLRWLVCSSLFVLPALVFGCEGGEENDHVCARGPNPILEVLVGPPLAGASVTTRGACTPVEFVEIDGRGNAYWRGRMTGIQAPCTVTVIHDGRTSEQTVVSEDQCGGPSPQRVFFGVSFK